MNLACFFEQLIGKPTADPRPLVETLAEIWVRTIYRSTYHEITDTIAPSKPMVIGEGASSEYGDSKAGWITNMFSWLPTNYPKVRGLLYFEKFDSGMDWPIETSSAATQAFSRGIRSAAYAANAYSRITVSPIPPPR